MVGTLLWRRLKCSGTTLAYSFTESGGCTVVEACFVCDRSYLSVMGTLLLGRVLFVTGHICL